MKKNFTLIMAALFSGCFALSAQEENLLEEGDFESIDINFFSYENSLQCPIYIPGWDLQSGIEVPDGLKQDDYNNYGLEKWNIRAEINYVVDPTEDNYQYLRLQRYEWNGWWDGSAGIRQTVAVVPNTTYKLSFMARVNPGQVKDGEGNPVSGLGEEDGFGTEDLEAFCRFIAEDHEDVVNDIKGMSAGQWDKENPDGNWKEYSFEYTAPEDVTSLAVSFGMYGGKVFEWGGNIHMYMDIDNVKLVGNSSSISTLAASQLKVVTDQGNIRISGIEGVNEAAVYNVAGQLMKNVSVDGGKAEFEMPAGLYLIGVGRETLKVTVK